MIFRNWKKIEWHLIFQKSSGDRQGECHVSNVLFILLGPPGAGKSTTCQLMAKEAGYVYYEADCTTNNLNPFIGTDVENPTIASLKQKPLKVFFFINALHCFIKWLVII